MSDGGVCRTAPATPGLLKTQFVDIILTHCAPSTGRAAATEPPKMRQTDQKIFFTVYNKYFMKPFLYSDFLVQKHSEFPNQVEELPEIDN